MIFEPNTVRDMTQTRPRESKRRPHTTQHTHAQRCTHGHANEKNGVFEALAEPEKVLTQNTSQQSAPHSRIGPFVGFTVVGQHVAGQHVIDGACQTRAVAAPRVEDHLSRVKQLQILCLIDESGNIFDCRRQTTKSLALLGFTAFHGTTATSTAQHGDRGI